MYDQEECVGSDMKADRAAMEAGSLMQAWRAIPNLLHSPFETRADGECWARMEQVFELQ
jgi:L-rhamnose mutarotase